MHFDCCSNSETVVSRRDMLTQVGCGFGAMAFAAMLAQNSMASTILGPDGRPALVAGKTTAKAKRVIFLYMAGGPSHLDTFDYKPELANADGKNLSVGRGSGQLLASPWKFQQGGKSGLWISDLFPNVRERADDICLLRGMKTAVPAHAQASVMMHTGSFQFVRPSFGSWVLYGLGSANENLPGFITINPGNGNGGAQNYGASFLPASVQGTRVDVARNGNRGGGGGRGQATPDEPIEDLRNDRYTRSAQREQIDFVQTLNKERQRREKDSAIEGLIESYELAFRMQAEVPELIDLTNEKQSTLDMYGIGQTATDGFGRQCLLARRFAEEGVRFIEVSQGGWDTHRNLRADLERQCGVVDRPIAALLTDLKQRGMLDDTLVIWGGEFGRTPYAQNGDGRDHNAKGFTIWMAGGGVKGGLSYGSTDATGGEAVDGVMDIHAWHATALHLMGLDHSSLTFNHAGRDFRLTDVKGRVVPEIVA